MKNTPVSQLKARLSEYLRKVKGGESVVVTDHGQAIAKLIPFPQWGEDENVEVARLVETGILEPAAKALDESLLQKPSIRDSQRRTLQALLQERETGY